MPNKKIEDVDLLQSAITDMDSLSQEGFSEIAAIARLAIKSMENKEHQTPRDMEDILHAMNIIWGKTEDFKNCINGEAEDVGCSHTSKATQQLINEALEACHEQE